LHVTHTLIDQLETGLHFYHSQLGLANCKTLHCANHLRWFSSGKFGVTVVQNISSVECHQFGVWYFVFNTFSCCWCVHCTVP